MRNPQLEKSEKFEKTFKTCDWVFTLNNFRPAELKKIIEYDCNYLVCGEEIAPKTGTPHLQGFFQFENPKLFSTLKKAFPRMYLGVRKGTPTQASDYCKYLDYPINTILNDKLHIKGELDPKDKQGARVDLEKVADQILNGELTCRDILRNTPYKYHLYGRTFEKLEDLRMSETPRLYPCEECLYIFGGAGLGKSYNYWEQEYFSNPKKFYVYPVDSNEWMDSYRQQEVFVLDDFRGELTFKKILGLANQLGHCVRRRGRDPMPFLSKKIVITSSLPVEKVFKNLDKDDRFEQFYRRFTIIKITEKYSKGVILNPFESSYLREIGMEKIEGIEYDN